MQVIKRIVLLMIIPLMILNIALIAIVSIIIMMMLERLVKTPRTTNRIYALLTETFILGNSMVKNINSFY